MCDDCLLQIHAIITFKQIDSIDSFLLTNQKKFRFFVHFIEYLSIFTIVPLDCSVTVASASSRHSAPIKLNIDTTTPFTNNVYLGEMQTAK